ncbi:MAG TPA: methyltransferase domain-containing protein [Dehalococcoidia bacterium]|nr:methyltransferase domain-containing protein [Dehalococcoidia bacterium]
MPVDPASAEDEALRTALTLGRYPRAAAYDPRWQIDNLMGPNVLWLTEALCQALPLAPGMRVLDLGCGKALSSIFLARELGVQVWAADLWIKPSENWARLREAGLEDRVFPIYAEAHALPFAEGFFDAIVSMDAYHYFGTADLYLPYCLRFLREGGRFGIVVPGIRRELPRLPPPKLAAYWEADFSTFHSPAWWRRHWQKSLAVAVERADWLPQGWEDWLTWNRACALAGRGSARETALLEADGGELLGFSRVVARRLPAHGAGA